jgi:hypothetical protein
VKLLLLLGSFLLFNSYSWAERDCSDPQTVEALLECNALKRLLEAGRPPQNNCLDGRCDETTSERLNRRGAGLPKLAPSFSNLGAVHCTNFIRNDGSFGEWGQIIDQYIVQPNVRDRFLGNNIAHITDACPRWAQLNQEQRRHFWVWVFAAIAWDESKCRERERNPNGTNGPVVGLMQMEERRGARTWRGPNCRVNDIVPARANILCSLDIMAELLRGPQGEYRGSGAIFRNGVRNTSYWEKLRRPNGGQVGGMIKSHPLCQ